MVAQRLKPLKASACNLGDLGSIPGSGRQPGEGNGNPLQYSCLENPMDGGVWQATVCGVTKSQTQLGDFTFTFTHNNNKQKYGNYSWNLQKTVLISRYEFRDAISLKSQYRQKNKAESRLFMETLLAVAIVQLLIYIQCPKIKS